jgi:hypothetical protein
MYDGGRFVPNILHNKHPRPEPGVFVVYLVLVYGRVMPVTEPPRSAIVSYMACIT